MKKGRKQLVLIIIGPPGSGKGTQGKLIAKKYGLNYIVCGDLVRELRAQNTPLGQKVKSFYDKGIPQPDKVIIQAINQKLSSLTIKNGILFDTFPLSLVQAVALEKILKKLNLPQPYTLYLDIKSSTAIKRAVGRLVCSGCGKIYLPDNSKSYLKKQCFKCGGKLIQRADDKPKVIDRRIREYKSRMQDLRNYYYKKDKLLLIDGEPTIPEVTKNIFAKLKEITTKKT